MVQECDKPISTFNPVCDDCAVKPGTVLRDVEWDQRNTLRPAPFKGPLTRLLKGLNVGDPRVDALPTSAVCCLGGKARKIGMDPHPPWVDWAKVRLGQEVFMRYLFQSFIALFFTLLHGFSIARLSEVLYHNGYARSKETAFERYRGTAFAVMDWMTYPLDDETSFAHVQLQTVRAMHSFARRRSVKLFDPSKGEGVPLSQYDTAEVQLAFAGIAMDVLQEEFQVKLTEEEQEAWCHTWRLIGYHLGIQDEYNACNSLEDMRALVKEHWTYFPARFRTCRRSTFELQRPALHAWGTYLGLGVELFRGILHTSCDCRDLGEKITYLEEPCLPGMKTVGAGMVVYILRNKYVNMVGNAAMRYMRDDFLHNPDSAKAKLPIFAGISRFNDLFTWPVVGAVVLFFTDPEWRKWMFTVAMGFATYVSFAVFRCCELSLKMVVVIVNLIRILSTKNKESKYL